LIRVVVDANIALKWVVREPGTEDALALRARYLLSAPDLLIAECANALWKKVARREIPPEFADMAAALLQLARIELVPMRALLRTAIELSLALRA